MVLGLKRRGRLTLQFIGATGTVTGSKYLLSVDKKHTLIDCGLFQGLKILRLRNWSPLPISPKEIEAVILTHAHIDHSGYLPLLVKKGFRGKIYATAGTRALCQVLLPDAGRLQEEDAAFANKKAFSRHKPALPLYTEEDALTSLRYFESIPWERKVTLSKHVSFRFWPAGHILGAGFVQFLLHGRPLTFSGDIGRPKDLLMKPPVAVPETEYLVIESTYGDRLHPREDPEETLGALVRQTVDRGGIVLIPAFAVGRAQEVLTLLSRLKEKKAIPDVPVFLNSPMAIEATKLLDTFAQEFAITPEECRRIFDGTRFVSTVEESKALNARREPCVILSASGMATGGRVLHHLKSLLPDPRHLILFVGFQAAGTRGESLVRGAESIKIHGEEIPVRAEIRLIDTLSAHADAAEILGWLRHFPRAPKLTFLTHGEPLAAEALRKKVDATLHWSCIVPDYLETFPL